MGHPPQTTPQATDGKQLVSQNEDTHKLSDELQRRKDLAAIQQAEAVAAKAAADARAATAAAAKAEADSLKAGADARRADAEVAAAVAKAQADARQSDATARKADAEATKQARDTAEHAGATAQAKREAVERKETAEANKAAAAARRDQLATLIPDISKVEPSKLNVSDGPAFAASPLTYRALQRAANTVCEQMAAAVKTKRVLVTSDEDLATPDATYWDVRTNLKELVTSADVLLKELDAAKTAGLVETAALAPVIDAAAAVAAAIPSVLSLFSADRTLRSAAVTVNDITAAAAVTGALTASTNANKPTSVVHDDFRLLPGTTAERPERGKVPEGIYDLSASINHRRTELRVERLVVVERKADTDENLKTNASAVAAAEKGLKDAEPADKEAKGKDVDDLRKARAGLESKAARDEARLAAIDAVLTGLDAFAAAVRTVPSGAKRSPLATAALHEQLHTGRKFDVVLLARAEAGQTQQVVTNKPLWFRDRFATIVDVGITYMLISVTDSSILAAGTAPGTATATGKLGDSISINIDGESAPAAITIVAASASSVIQP